MRYVRFGEWRWLCTVVVLMLAPRLCIAQTQQELLASERDAIQRFQSKTDMIGIAVIVAAILIGVILIAFLRSRQGGRLKSEDSLHKS